MTSMSDVSARAARSHELMLRFLGERGMVTRSELSRLTGLSRSAVSEAVQVLIANGVVVEQGATQELRGARGRPSSLLSLVNSGAYVVGIDFGHVHVTVAVADPGGTILAEHRQNLDVDNEPQLALDTAAGLTARTIQMAGLVAADICCVAAGIPGPVDLRTQVVTSPSILAEWVGLDPHQELQDRIGLPVTLRNDADMGALGEMRFGAAQGLHDFLYVKASDGIGAGMVLNGESYRGALGMAGEIGHTQIPGMGNYCRCGNRGCLETVVSTSELLRELSHVLTPADLDKAAESFKHVSAIPTAARIVRDAGRTLGRVLADACNLLNPEAVIVGGQLGAAGAPFIAGIQESINRHTHKTLAGCIDVRAASLGLRAELMGSISTALRKSVRAAPNQNPLTGR